MKRLAFIVALLAGIALLSAQAFGAATQTGKVVGVKGGLDVATLTGDDTDGFGWRATGVFGGFLCFRVNEFLSVQPELLIEMKGARLPDTATQAGTVETSVKLTYVEFPVTAKLYFPTQIDMKPYIYAGLGLGFKVSSRVKFAAGDSEAETNLDDIHGADLGMIIGGGFDLQAGPGAALFDIRYEIGFVSVDDSDEDLDWKNSVFSFAVGYGVPF